MSFFLEDIFFSHLVGPSEQIDTHDTVFHLPARPARISRKFRLGRRILKDVQPWDA